MKKIIPIITLGLGITLLTAFAKEKTSQEIKIGSKAPMADVLMKNVGVRDFTLNDLKKENGLIVVFSCNTCPFVVGANDFPGWEKDYAALNEKANSNGIGFTLVNSNEGKRNNDDSFEEMTRRAKEKGYKMPYLLDENSKLADEFGAKTTPHVYFFDKDMKLIYTGSIDNTWDPRRSKDISFLNNAIDGSASGKIEIPTSEPKGCSIKRVAPTK